MKKSLLPIIFCISLVFPSMLYGEPSESAAQGLTDLQEIATSVGLLEEAADFESDGFDAVHLSWDPSPAAGTAGYNVYRSILRYDPERRPEITVDGNLKDWNSVRKANTYPYPEEDLLHIQDVYVTHDDANLYLAVKCTSSIADAAMTEIFLDVDQDLSTGSGSKDWRGLPIGAEIMFYYNHPDTIYRKVWDPSWEGPYPYNEFVSNNYADPAHAWKDAYDMTWIGAAEFGTSKADVIGSLLARDIPRSWENNVWEMKVPFEDLRELTGYEIDPAHFGIDIVVSTNFDQFPTVGYGPKSPMKFSYGYEKVNDEPVSGTTFDDHPFDGLEYEYTVFAVDSTGDEHLLDGWPKTADVAKSMVDDFNVSINDEHSLAVEFDFPDNDSLSEVKILRRDDRYPEGPSDGDIIKTIPYEKGGHARVIDRGLQQGKSYFYAAYSTAINGTGSIEFWDIKDRSIPAAVRGPIEGLSPDDDYMAYFSSWDATRVYLAKKYDVVICHPGGGSQLITREQVDEIQRGLDGKRGTDDDVIVIGYVSIGEDFGINPQILRNNKVLGIHPNIDDYPEGVSWDLKNYYYPRKLETSTEGPVSYSYEDDTYTLSDSDDPTYQFPSFYVDMIDYMGQGGAGQDGLPDQNIEWGGLFVDPGNTLWQDFIREADITTDYVAGIDWVLGDEDGALGCDGIFLDTVGVSAAWSQWFPYTYYGDYFWTSSGFLDFFARIGMWYPDKILMPNRPMHFMFPNMMGKRYDDFRSLINAVFWESYSADVLFWWGGNYANIFEDTVVNAEDNKDDRGFSTFVLDYWNVMIDAEEGGEYQKAPWYDTLEDQIKRAEGNDFISFVSGSRSMAEFSDFVYYYHHPEERNLPDLYVHSIGIERAENDQVSVKVNITNHGKAVDDWEHFWVQVYQNDRLIREFDIAGLRYLEIKSFDFLISPDDIGNDIRVMVDTRDDIEELDELPGHESNNTKGRYVDRYLEFVEGWYPTGFAPDVIIEDITFSSDYPVVNKPLVITLHYKNISDEGVAPESRLYYWLQESDGRKTLGNIPTPFLMPGESKDIPIVYTPRSFGDLAIGITADGTFKIIEQSDLNNYYDTRVPVVSSQDSGIAEPLDQLGPFNDILGDGTAGVLAADIKEVTIARDAETTYFNMKFPEKIQPRVYAYMIFIDAPLNDGPGYPVSNLQAGYLISGGALWRYTGEDSGSWSWKKLDAVEGFSYSVIDDSKGMEFGIPSSLLYAEDTDWGNIMPEDQLGAIYYVSDEDNETLDEIYPSYTTSLAFPPMGKRITIDGNMADWALNAAASYTGRESVDDGFNKRLLNVANAIGGYADMKKISVTFDESYFYIQLTMDQRISLDLIDYSIYFDLDLSEETGYLLRNNQFGADCRILNGVFYTYEGDGFSWEWAPSDKRVFSSLGNTRYPQSLEMALEYGDLFEGVPEMEIYIVTSDKKGVGWEDDIDDFFPDASRSRYIIPLDKIDEVYVESDLSFISQVEEVFTEVSDEDLYVQDSDEAVDYLLNTVVSVDTIDGNFYDWELDPNVVFIGKDVIENRPMGIQSYDIDTVSYVFHDGHFFVRTTVAGPIDRLDWRAVYYIDTDDDKNTGYVSKNHGYDYMMQGDGNLFYLEDGKELKPVLIGMVPLMVSKSDQMAVEFAIPEAMCGGFNDEFVLYVRYGAQETRFSAFDEYGPVRLSRYNKLLPTDKVSLPPIFLAILAGIFILLLFALNTMNSYRTAKKHKELERKQAKLSTIYAEPEKEEKDEDKKHYDLD